MSFISFSASLQGILPTIFRLGPPAPQLLDEHPVTLRRLQQPRLHDIVQFVFFLDISIKNAARLSTTVNWKLSKIIVEVFEAASLTI